MKISKLLLTLTGIIMGTSLAHATINIDAATYHERRMEEKKARLEAERFKPFTPPQTTSFSQPTQPKPEVVTAETTPVTIDQKIYETTVGAATPDTKITKDNKDTKDIKDTKKK